MKKRHAGAGLAVAIAIAASGCANTIDGHAQAKEPPKPALAASVSTDSSDFDLCDVALTNAKAIVAAVPTV